MKLKLILSVLLLTIFLAALCQEKLSGKTKRKNSAIVESGLIKVSIMYPYAEGKTFDIEYYKTKHMPMVAKIIGSNLVKYTIEKGIASGIASTPLPYMAIGTFYLKDLAAYQAAIGPKRDSIRSDFPNYTNAIPIILVSEIIK